MKKILIFFSKVHFFKTIELKKKSDCNLQLKIKMKFYISLAHAKKEEEKSFYCRSKFHKPVTTDRSMF